MKLINQSYEILSFDPNRIRELKNSVHGLDQKLAIYRNIVESARVSYHSDASFDESLDAKSKIDKYGQFIRSRIREGHESVLEHAALRIKFVTNRAVANELTRHRLISWTQESTRYCNYSNGKFDSQVSFIFSPYFEFGTAGFDSFVAACENAEKEYFALLNIGYTAQQARDVLPLSTKTVLVGTGNIREWRHLLKLRAAEETGPVHPMMKALTAPLLEDLKDVLPDLFYDIDVKKKEEKTYED